MKQAAWTLILAAAFAAIGLAGGWIAARQTQSAGGHGGHEAGEGGDEHGHGGHAPAVPVLSEQARLNLGLKVAEADTEDYWKRQPVQAVVADSPRSLQPIFAPIGGRVTELNALPGAVVPAGGVVVTLIREPLPRPKLILTDPILKPANEDFHGAVGEMRRAARGLELLNAELERVQKFVETGTQDGLPILPRKNVIDLRYEIARGEMEVQNAEQELRRHGVTDAQLAELAKGRAAAVLGQQVWRQALQQNGLWPAAAEALYAALPAEAQALPWSVAAVGELAAAGIPLADLTVWLKAEPAAAAHFIEIAGLLQEGHALTAVKALHAVGGLEEVVRISAPAPDGVPDWDVLALDAKPGQQVERGQVLGTLANPRELQLRAEPVGGEVAAVLAAASQGGEIEAVPLLKDTGPHLKGLKLAYVTSDPDGHGTLAVLGVPNEALETQAGTKPEGRTWRLRPGLRYTLRVPVEKFGEAFVLPSDAVTDDGPDKVVFIEDGGGFKPAKVVVLHRDHETVVLDSRFSELFPGDRVVTRGAFGLGVALKAGSGGIDPHAGHNH
ncbi:MAG: hypothetical protein M5U26_22830 [Planctomycetota bacterium]|nr:hypothetical protein [Planctomycetota bacterium]